MILLLIELAIIVGAVVCVIYYACKDVDDNNGQLIDDKDKGEHQ